MLSNISLKPSMTNWWARAMRERSLLWLNCLTISPPNRYPAPRGGEAPAIDFVGVGPEEVAHWSVVGNFLFAV